LSGTPRLAALSGALAGAALMTKQTALWPVIVAGALATWRGGKRGDGRSAAAFIAGAVVVPALWLAYFWSRGGLGSFWDCVVGGNMSYVAVAGWRDAAEQGRFFVAELAPAFLKGSAVTWLLAFFGLWGLEARWENRGELAAAFWLAAGLLAAATGLLLYPHYFLQAAPPLCLAASYGVDKLARRSQRLAWAALAGLALAPAVAQADVYFGSSRAVAAKDLLYPSPLLEVEWLGGWLKEHSPPGEPIWVYGSEPQLYVYADRRCATRHDFVYPLTMFPKSSEPFVVELAALREARPSYVVYINQRISTLIGSPLGLEFRDSVREWLASDYRLVGFVPVPREPAPSVLVPETRVDWLVANRLYVFRRR
jgi:hypothetical protein